MLEFKFLAQHLYPGTPQEKGVARNATVHTLEPRRTRGDQPRAGGREPSASDRSAARTRSQHDWTGIAPSGADPEHLPGHPRTARRGKIGTGSALSTSRLAAGDAQLGPQRQPARDGGWGGRIAARRAGKPPRGGLPWGGAAGRLPRGAVGTPVADPALAGCPARSQALRPGLETEDFDRARRLSFFATASPLAPPLVPGDHRLGLTIAALPC